jgi:hypothetical protein
MYRDKNFWKIFERVKCGPKCEWREARNKNANNASKIKTQLKSLTLFASFAFFADK